MNPIDLSNYRFCARGAVVIAMICWFGFLPGISTNCTAQQTNAVLQFSSPEYVVNENDGSVLITVTRTGITNGIVTVDYAPGKGSAIAGIHYTSQSGTLSFAAGETTKTFSIPILDNSLAEGTMTVWLVLSNPTGGAVLGAQATARLFIIDNENRGTLLDSTYNGAILPTDFVTVIAMQPDGKAVAGGSFARTDSQDPDRILRFNRDGSRDRNFGAKSGGPNNNVFALAMQPDGKIIIGGEFTQFGPTARNRIARLNPDGSLEPGFDPGSGAGGSVSPGVYSIVLQTDGRILIGGNFESVGGVARHSVARLNADGSLDATFDPGTGAMTTSTNFQVAWISAMALQPDAKVVLGGQFTDFNSVSRPNIARLNPDGSVDAGFAQGSGATGPSASVEAVTLQPDGKIIIGGDFTNIGDTARNAIARLNSNGSIDLSFDPGTGVKDRDANGAETVGLVTSLAVQSGGKILMGGTFFTFDDINRHGLSRSNPDGSLDGTFGPYFGTTYRNDLGYEEMTSVSAMALQPDGKVLIGGTFVSADGSRTNRLTRLLNANVRSTSFEFSTPRVSAGETTGHATVTVIRRGDSDAAFTVGYSTSPGTATPGTDYTPQTGTLRFGPLEVEKTITVPILNDRKLEEDETFDVVLSNPSAGAALGAPTNCVIRIVDGMRPGNLDFSFAPVTTPPPTDPVTFPPVMAIVVQKDAKVLVAGHFTSVNGTNRAGIARFNSDGSLDSTFIPQVPAGGQTFDFHQMGLQPDGSLVGGFDGVFRLSSTGALDTRFLPDVGSVNAVTVQTDGKVLISDEFFDPVANANVNEVARYSTNGAFDITFSPAPQMNDWVNAMAAQSDGKVVIGGYFTNVNGVVKNRIARLNGDGSLDTAFAIGSGLVETNAAVYALVVQPDGKVVVAGDFHTVNNVGRNHLARLNADGSVDPSFNPGTGPNNFVDALALQPDGKLLIGGGFTAVNGVQRFGLARLKNDGSLDDFSAKFTFPNAVFVTTIALQSDGGILVGGLFTEVNGIPRTGIVRLLGDAGFLKLDPTLPKPQNSFHLTVNSVPGKQYRLEASIDLVTWIPVSTSTATGFTLEFDDPTAGGPSSRFYRVVQLSP